ncbi:hypothetical protein PROFUN_06712 [Planoprotostelium fungivorum]|uniref:Uncharacterized protein n=1 Tax=Planoprotostelium fungivorum TaxID=1890364 RepID=A0A2P6NG70_9EUKA|nr:hypothetical protein PROFUN_06712 [Planoprotostelium fungivorum]
MTKIQRSGSCYIINGGTTPSPTVERSGACVHINSRMYTSPPTTPPMDGMRFELIDQKNSHETDGAAGL